MDLAKQSYLGYAAQHALHVSEQKVLYIHCLVAIERINTSAPGFKPEYLGEPKLDAYPCTLKYTAPVSLSGLDIPSNVLEDKFLPHSLQRSPYLTRGHLASIFF